MLYNMRMYTHGPIRNRDEKKNVPEQNHRVLLVIIKTCKIAFEKDVSDWVKERGREKKLYKRVWASNLKAFFTGIKSCLFICISIMWTVKWYPFQ